MAHRVVSGLGLAAALLALAGCATAGDPSPTPSAPEVVTATPTPSPSTSPVAAVDTLDVLCDADLVLTVSAESVVASSGGVVLNVTSEAPAGAYLNYGIGGDEMPAETATWTLGVAPGEMTLSCSTLEKEGEVVTVQVTDPNGFWSSMTMEDLGCPMGGIPSWAIPGATGATPEEAVAALADNFNEGGRDPAYTRWVRAGIGYADHASQTWIVGTEDLTQITAVVQEWEGEFQAWPDYICVSSPWVTEQSG